MLTVRTYTSSDFRKSLFEAKLSVGGCKPLESEKTIFSGNCYFLGQQPEMKTKKIIVLYALNKK